MQSKCSDCQHRNICKYKDEYEKAFNEITLKVADPFMLTLDCSYYYSTNAQLSYYSTWCNGIDSYATKNLQQDLPIIGRMDMDTTQATY